MSRRRVFTAGQLAEVLNSCCLRGGNPDAQLTGVACDSREVARGDLFVALKGETTDGHKYVTQAFERGARAALVNAAGLTEIETVDDDRALLCVPDTLLALGEAAKWYAGRFSVPTVAVTGSLGKTTCKDLVASVLGTHYSVLKSEGNYNTEIGVPLTLFKLAEEHQIAVVEVAMRKPGDLTYLAEMLQPEVGVLTNVAESHLEFFGSVSEIAAGKAELFEHLPAEGWAVLNGEDDWGRWIASQTDARLLFYYRDRRTDLPEGDAPVVTGANVELDSMSRPEFDLYISDHQPVRVRLPVAGAHHVMNALAAASVGALKGIPPDDIRWGLTEASITGMRTEWIQCSDDVLILSDAYNSSPTSCRAALRTLIDCDAGHRKVALLGDMLELGQMQKPGHIEVGKFAARCGVDYLITVGSRAELISRGAKQAGLPKQRRRHLSDIESLIPQLDNLIEPGDAVLVKASRGCRLERCVRALKGIFPPDDRLSEGRG